MKKIYIECDMKINFIKQLIAFFEKTKKQSISAEAQAYYVFNLLNECVTANKKMTIENVVNVFMVNYTNLIDDYLSTMCSEKRQTAILELTDKDLFFKHDIVALY